MKNIIFLILSCFLFVFSFSQTPSGFGDWYNATKDFASLSANMIGDGVTDNADKLQTILKAEAAHNVYFPDGRYVINHDALIGGDNKYYKGAGKGRTFFIVKAGHSMTDLMLAIGLSNIKIEGITFLVEKDAKGIEAFLRFNSHPRHNHDITVEDCEFTGYVKNAILMGNTTLGDTTHTNDMVFITRNWFHDIYDPKQPVITTGDYTNISDRFYAINLAQTTRRAFITYNRMERLSGDAILGWGWSADTSKIAPDPLYGNWLIQANTILHTWMGVEVQGNGNGRNLKVFDNYIYDPTCDGGYGLSLIGFNVMTDRNTIITFNRNGAEFKGIQCTYGHDKIFIYPWKKGCYGTQTSTKMYQANGVDASGFNNTYNTEIDFEYNGYTDDYTPQQLSGIHCVGKGDNLEYADTAWKGITDYPYGFMLEGVKVYDYTYHAVYAEVHKIRNVHIEHCTFTTRYAIDVPIPIWGYGWVITDNDFDFGGSPAPANGVAAIMRRSLQTDKTNSSVYNNRLRGDLWKNDVFRNTNASDFSF